MSLYVEPPMLSRTAGLRRDIQGLRTLAVLLVVVFHTGFALPGGFIGVDVFFVLSGFLIVGLLDREAERSGRLDLPAFFARRARRLLPVLAFVTTVTVIASTAFVGLGAPLGAVTRTAAGASLFAANAVLYQSSGYFAPAAELNPLLHTWSLSVEEQFYLVTPVVLAVALALHRKGCLRGVSRRRAWMLLLGLGSLLSFVLNVALVDLGGQVPGLTEATRFAFYSPFTRAWQFGVGGLLAIFVASGRLPWRAHAPVLLPLGLALILFSALVLDDASAFPGARAVLPSLGTLLALMPGSVAERQSGWVPMNVLESRHMVFVGDLSYGWYLWHWPAIVLARAVFGGAAAIWVAVTISFGLALLSKRFIEDHYRFDRRLIGARAARFAALCVTVPLLAALGVSAANERVADRAGIGLDERSWSRSSCHVQREEPEEWRPDLCTRGAGAFVGSVPPSLDVLLLGDSHADSLADGVLAAAERLGLSMGVRTVSGQPPLGLDDWVRRHSELIELTDPGIVILAARSTFYVSSEGRRDRWSETQNLSGYDEVQIQELWVEELRAAARQFRSLGPRVIWVQNVPEFPERTATLLAPKRFQSISLDELAVQRGGLLARERRALDDIEGVTVVDPAKTLCAPECRNGDADEFFYYDSDHLSPVGSRLLTGRFESALRGAVLD
jgi:peptidoglycan/LPS O-acetylase OafA/YrhL